MLYLLNKKSININFQRVSRFISIGFLLPSTHRDKTEKEPVTFRGNFACFPHITHKHTETLKLLPIIFEYEFYVRSACNKKLFHTLTHYSSSSRKVLKFIYYLFISKRHKLYHFIYDNTEKCAEEAPVMQNSESNSTQNIIK